MEGRALDQDPRRQWGWVVPWLLSALVPLAADVTGADRVSSFALGLVGGVAWQLIHRRDLASRLWVLSVLVGFGVGASLVTRSPIIWSDMDTTGLYAIGVLLSLVWTEHVQRWRERSAWRRPSPERATTRR